MANRKSVPSQPVAAKVFYTLGAVLMTLGLLSVAREVLIPVALSVLLAFILSPLVIWLERWRVGRIPAVLIASFFAFALIGLCAWALVSQVHSLAVELPSHRQEIQAKINSLSASEDSTLSRLTRMFDEVTEEIVKDADSNKADDSAIGGLVSAPIPVVVKDQNNPLLSGATDILVPIVQPLAQAALVIVLVMFLLIQREDVRYRVISLMGDAALTGTTRLMRDTAERVSKYLLNLLLVNAGFGLWFAIGLQFLGVPYAALWGFLTLVFRFIPFLGSPASVLFPLLISIATSTGWSQPIYVAVFFAISELFTGNVIEPIVFGKTTGLTPIALLVAALFWAWIWGPIGLLLSTPLTVCLVVLGQHLPHLRSLKVLLAEQPTLDARLQFFQRLLSGDAEEGKRVFDDYSNEFGRDRAFDEVVIPALKWTRRERNKDVITPEEEKFIYSVSNAMTAVALDVNQPGDGRAATNDGADPPTTAVATSDVGEKVTVFGYPVHHDSEEVALLMLEQMLQDSSIVSLANTKQLPSKVVDDIVLRKPDVVVLSAMPPGGMPQVRFMCSEIRKRCDDLVIIVACFGKLKNYDELLVSLRKSGATYLTTSLAQTKHQVETLRDDQSGPVIDPVGEVAHVQ